jgi:hypothetical protein
MITKVGRALMAASAMVLMPQVPGSPSSLGPDEKPWVGALYPDTPLAQGHNGAA